MKIALQNELPAPEQFQRLIQSISDTLVPADAAQYDAYKESPHVIAAYDQEQLVALGRLVVRGEADSELEFAVSPSYKGREIEENMRRLLQIRSLKV
jgi:hypothetical protein